jgi:hypothetical protein
MNGVNSRCLQFITFGESEQREFQWQVAKKLNASESCYKLVNGIFAKRRPEDTKIEQVEY